MQTETVGVVAGDVVLLGDALGTFELADELIVAKVGPAHRAAEPGLLAGKGIRTNRKQAHGLDSARHHDVFDTRGDQCMGLIDRLLRRAALGIDRGGGDFFGATMAQPRGAGDVHCLSADLVDAAAYDLTNVRGLDASSVDDFHHHRTKDIGRMRSRQ